MKQPDRILVAALNPFMEQHGFKFLRSRETYLRKRSDGFDDFTWSSYPLASGPKWESGYYEGHYGLGLRYDAVEKIYDVLDTTYGEENKRYRPTIYRGVGGYFPFDSGRDREFCLRFDHLEEDGNETVRRIKMMLMADGFAWYARYADPVALSRELNDPILNNGEHRPLVGLAAACIAESDRVPSLVDAYLDYTKSEDERLADKRDPQAPALAVKFEKLTLRARELGYPV